MLSFSYDEKSSKFYKNFALVRVVLAYSSNESAINSMFYFMMYIVFGTTCTSGCCSKIFTVSRMILVVSTAFLTPFNSVISLGFIESTACSAFLR